MFVGLAALLLWARSRSDRSTTEQRGDLSRHLGRAVLHSKYTLKYIAGWLVDITDEAIGIIFLTS